jgi:hypothetical protein
VLSREYLGDRRSPKNRFVWLDRWRRTVPEHDWVVIDGRDGKKGQEANAYSTLLSGKNPGRRDFHPAHVNF